MSELLLGRNSKVFRLIKPVSSVDVMIPGQDGITNIMTQNQRELTLKIDISNVSAENIKSNKETLTQIIEYARANNLGTMLETIYGSFKMKITTALLNATGELVSEKTIMYKPTVSDIMVLLGLDANEELRYRSSMIFNISSDKLFEIPQPLGVMGTIVSNYTFKIKEIELFAAKEIPDQFYDGNVHVSQLDVNFKPTSTIIEDAVDTMESIYKYSESGEILNQILIPNTIRELSIELSLIIHDEAIISSLEKWNTLVVTP